MKVLRDGALLDLKYQLKQRRPLVPILHGVDCVPSYFIVGGLVFVPLSIPFLEHAYGGMSLFDLGERQVFCHAYLLLAISTTKYPHITFCCSHVGLMCHLLGACVSI